MRVRLFFVQDPDSANRERLIGRITGEPVLFDMIFRNPDFLQQLPGTFHHRLGPGNIKEGLFQVRNQLLDRYPVDSFGRENIMNGKVGIMFRCNFQLFPVYDVRMATGVNKRHAQGHTLMQHLLNDGTKRSDANLKNTVKLVSHAPIKIIRMKISYGVKPSSIGGPRNKGIKKAIWGVAIKTRQPKNNCK
jgi:hypothetical protein